MIRYLIRYMTSVQLSWKGINLKTKDGKNILSDISGFSEGGKVTGIMGPSGSGKTSLLNILACRVDTQQFIDTGLKTANSQQYAKDQFGQFGAYLSQSDILLESLTVAETIGFSCELKCRPDIDFVAQTQTMIQQLRLEECRDTIIGGQFLKGISGGEKKRVCIACELVNEPRVLIMDEPTSGLDSFAAEQIVSLLKQYAQNGSSVLVTIHQPSSPIFQMIDRLIVLDEGKVVFQGEPMEIIPYLESLNCKMPQHMNPADFLMKQIGKSITAENY